MREIKHCVNCDRDKEFPETDLFVKDYPGWCFECIHEDINFKYKEKHNYAERNFEQHVG